LNNKSFPLFGCYTSLQIAYKSSHIVHMMSCPRVQNVLYILQFRDKLAKTARQQFPARNGGTYPKCWGGSSILLGLCCKFVNLLNKIMILMM